MLNSKRDFLKDIERIRSLSSVIDKKLSEIKPSDNEKITKLTLDELQDLDKIAGIADFMLTKYADKKEMYSILKHFTPIITETMDSMGNLDDEISELILSAEEGSGIFWFIVKTFGVSVLMLLPRGISPRIRIDILLRTGWAKLIAVAFINIFVAIGLLYTGVINHIGMIGT